MIKIQTFDLGAIFCMILSRVMAAVFADPLRDKKSNMKIFLTVPVNFLCRNILLLFILISSLYLIPARKAKRALKKKQGEKVQCLIQLFISMRTGSGFREPNNCDADPDHGQTLDHKKLIFT
jgi:hypothetical protein